MRVLKQRDQYLTLRKQDEYGVHSDDLRNLQLVVILRAMERFRSGAFCIPEEQTRVLSSIYFLITYYKPSAIWFTNYRHRAESHGL
jgi:hypothetical protein